MALSFKAVTQDLLYIVYLCCLQLLMTSLVMSVLYVWAQYNKDMTVAYWFDMRFKVTRILISAAHCVESWSDLYSQSCSWNAE